MKVLLINGSPKAERCTFTALSEVAKTLEAEGIETEIVHIGNQAIRGCIDCRACKKNANGNLISFLDRLFFSTPFDKSMKVGAAVVSARRGGCSATFDELNKYFTIVGKNMAFLIKSIALGKEKYGLPEREPQILTNFID